MDLVKVYKMRQIRHVTKAVQVRGCGIFLVVIALSCSGCGSSNSTPVAGPSSPVSVPAKPTSPALASSSVATNGVNGVFEEAGKFSVGVPEEGFQWKKVQDIDSGNQRGAAYSCTKKNSQKVMSLSYVDLSAKTDGDKRNFVAGKYNGSRKGLEQINAKILEEAQPDLGSDVPNRVSYHLKVRSANGAVFCVYSTTIFGKRAISITARAPDSSEAKAFCDKVVESLKELDH